MAIEPVLLSSRGGERKTEREREAVAVGYRPASWTMEKYRSQHPPDYHHVANDTTNTTTSTPLPPSTSERETLASLSTTHRRFSLWARISVHVREIGRSDSYCRLQIGVTTRFFQWSDENSPTVLKGHRYGFTFRSRFSANTLPIRFRRPSLCSALWSFDSEICCGLETGTFANDALS